MAELPELEYLLKVFSRELAGKRIVEAECLNPERLDMLIDGDFADRLTGLKVTKVRRRGPFLLIRTNSEERLVIRPEDEGFFKFPGLGTRRPRSLIFAVHMEGGPRMWFLDSGDSARVYLTSKQKENLAEVPDLMTQGSDPLGKNYSPEKIRRIAKKKSKSTIWDMLTDQKQISHIGPVYASEILYRVRLHPKTMVKALGEDDLDRIYDASLDILEDAIDEIEGRGQPIENTVRDFLAIWGRGEEACKRCGGDITTIKMDKDRAFICKNCQTIKK